jgi:hypothetical protein
MNRVHIGLFILLCGALASCGHSRTQVSGIAQTPPPAAHASIGDFTDYVLEPLALRVADEKIMEASAGMKLAQTPKGAVQSVASLLQEVPWIGRILNFTTVSQKARLEEDLAWLETRRLPLKRELLDALVAQTSHEEDTFTTCIDGVQRRYQALDINRFTRLPDGSGPCAPLQLYSLRKPKERSLSLF